MKHQICPCGTGKHYDNCCGAFIEKQNLPATPEELMRSRYTAYSQANIDYIVATMTSPASDDFDKEEARQWATKIAWLKLEVLKSGQDGDKGMVEFRAHYAANGKQHAMHEISEFHLVDGQWFYVDGDLPKHQITSVSSEKIGRNDPCLCGSKKKYKKCCGR